MIKFLKKLFVKEKNLITPPKGSLERVLGYEPDFTKAPNGVVEQIFKHRQDLDKNRNGEWLPKETGKITKIKHWLKTEKPDLSEINESEQNISSYEEYEHTLFKNNLLKKRLFIL